SKATFSGEGTEASPYLISTAQQLANLATLVNSGNTHYSAAHYKLQNNIDISEYDSNWNNGEGWIPIGNEYLGISFSGIFDGAGKAISGLFIYGTGYNVGLFGAVQGTVKNLGVVNVNLYDNSGSAVGSIVGLLHGPDSKIINCYSSGTLYSTTYAGGIVGYVFGGGTVTGNIALNQWVKSTYIINHAGRVVGRASGTNTISDNFAWAGMTTNGGVDFTDETTLLSSVEVVLKSKDFGIAEVPQYIIDDLPSLSGATITHNATYAYTGSAITPNITVTLDGSVLTKGVHYSITALANNTSAGEASFSIAAITPFKGTKAGNAFTITKVNPIVPAAPANLTAKEGQKLAEIALPQNWHWMKETEYVGKVGEQTHQAKYVPTDTENYNTIENIDVKITVSSELTPIAHHVPYPMSHVPKYYTLKGIPLGTAKPTAPGVYIVKIGTQTQRVVVK
ncbi:MAG: hypothetical protein FWC26_07850, partial [Fibromonadales bacterium]|nr:hypothetical protein [Fibromonadales bacterium]